MRSGWSDAVKVFLDDCPKQLFLIVANRAFLFLSFFLTATRLRSKYVPILRARRVQPAPFYEKLQGLTDGCQVA